MNIQIIAVKINADLPTLEFLFWVPPVWRDETGFFLVVVGGHIFLESYIITWSYIKKNFVQLISYFF